MNSKDENNNPFEKMTDDVFGEPELEEVVEEIREEKTYSDPEMNYSGNNGSDDERQWAMFAHLSSLAGYLIPFGHIVGPLIIWSIKKEEMPLVDEHGKDALNFQISMVILMIIAGLFSIILIGIPFLIGLALCQLIAPIIAAVKISNGEKFTYPLTKRFIK